MTTPDPTSADAYAFPELATGVSIPRWMIEENPADPLAAVYAATRDALKREPTPAYDATTAHQGHDPLKDPA